MRTQQRPSERGFTASDRRRLAKALTQVPDRRTYRRVHALYLVSEGDTINEVAQITRMSVSDIFRYGVGLVTEAMS
jgi:hypothetical protein